MISFLPNQRTFHIFKDEKLRLPPKLYTFLRIVLHGELFTKLKDVEGSSSLILFVLNVKLHTESLDHILKRCKISKSG